MIPPRATIGTPRNDASSGARAATSRGSAGRGGCRACGRAPADVEHRAEQPVRARERAHRRDQRVAHARGDEALEGALAVGDADRRVPRAGEPARGVDEALQHRLDRALGGDRQHRVAHRAQGRALLLHLRLEDTPGSGGAQERVELPGGALPGEEARPAWSRSRSRSSPIAASTWVAISARSAGSAYRAASRRSRGGPRHRPPRPARRTPSPPGTSGRSPRTSEGRTNALAPA